MRAKEFTTFDLVKSLKIPRSNLQQYIDRGLVRPSLGTARGKGTRNKFSLEDVYRLRLFQTLHQAGLSQKEAAKHANDFDFGGIVTSFDWLLIAPSRDGKMTILCDVSHIHELLLRRSAVLYIAINVGKIMLEVDEKLSS